MHEKAKKTSKKSSELVKNGKEYGILSSTTENK
jgi:hypothetical protein